MHARLSDSIQSTIDKIRQCREQETSENYEALDGLFRRLNIQAREAIHAALRREARQISDKLEKGRQLTLEEQETLATLIVGVARTYLDLETDYSAWKAKVERLAGEIEALEADNLNSAPELLRLQALCLQARNVLPNLTYYLRERERVERFETSMQSRLDLQSSKFLAEVLREMLQSARL